MLDNPILEAALENVESVVDTLTKNELVREIPVVGTTVKLLRGARDIRDRLFAAKLLRFIQKLESVSPETRGRIRQKITNDSDEARKIGETAILVVERIAAPEKADLIAILFLAYIDEQIDVTEFRRLCLVIDHAFFDDLMEPLSCRELPNKSKEPFMQNLSSTELVTPVPGDIYGDIGQLFYGATKLAQKLRHAYEHGLELLNERRQESHGS